MYKELNYCQHHYNNQVQRRDEDQHLRIAVQLPVPGKRQTWRSTKGMGLRGLNEEDV